MAFDWSDPMFWTAATGTALGGLSGIYSATAGRSAYDDLVRATQMQQRAAQAAQQQAIDWAKARETQMQAAASQPLDINAFFSPMQDAQVQALQRWALANKMGTGMSPELAQRMFGVEMLPQFIAGQWQAAATLAQQQRNQQLNALGFMPSIEMLYKNPVPWGAEVQNAMRGFPNFSAMGDVSSLGSYFKGQQMRTDQLAAQKAATDNQIAWRNAIRDVSGPKGMEQVYAPGVSSYDSHNDRLGTNGVDTRALFEGGGS